MNQTTTRSITIELTPDGFKAATKWIDLQKDGIMSTQTQSNVTGPGKQQIVLLWTTTEEIEA